MKRIIICLGLISLLGVGLLLAQQEELTITTYYPSPHGVYNELRSKKMAIGDTWFESGAFPWDTDGGNPEGSEIRQDANLVVEGNVGIGTTNPFVKSKLTIVPDTSGSHIKLVCEDKKTDIFTLVSLLGDPSPGGTLIAGPQYGSATAPFHLWYWNKTYLTWLDAWRPPTDPVAGEVVPGDDIVYNYGNVGIGPYIPLGKFEVNPDNVYNNGDEFVVTTTGVGIRKVNDPKFALDVAGTVNLDPPDLLPNLRIAHKEKHDIGQVVIITGGPIGTLYAAPLYGAVVPPYHLYYYNGAAIVTLDVWQSQGINITQDIFFNDGEVGIGTRSPLGKLHVDQNNDSVCNENTGTCSGPVLDDVIFRAGNVGVGDVAPDGKFEVNPNGIEDDGDEFVIANNGNVGIGTGINVPTDKLEIFEGSIKLSPTLNGTYDPFILIGSDTFEGVKIWYDNDVADVYFDVINDWGGVGWPALHFRTEIESGTPREVMTITNDGRVGIGTATPNYQLELSQDSAAKPTSSAWTVPSDIRLKKGIEPFNDGLDIVMKLNPVKYRLNGKAGTPKDQEGISVLAQDIEDIAPYAVRTYKAKLESTDKEATELFTLDSSPFTFVMINAIKEQQQQIDDLKSEINQLKTQLNSR